MLCHVMARCFAFDVVRQSQNEFADRLLGEAVLQQGQIQFIRADAVNRRLLAMEDVVRAPKRATTFEGN